jgi:hypothetical protein
VFLHCGDYDSVVEMVFKTEFLTLLTDKYEQKLSKTLPIAFTDSVTFKVKKVHPTNPLSFSSLICSLRMHTETSPTL